MIKLDFEAMKEGVSNGATIKQIEKCKKYFENKKTTYKNYSEFREILLSIPKEQLMDIMSVLFIYLPDNTEDFDNDIELLNKLCEIRGITYEQLCEQEKEMKAKGY